MGKLVLALGTYSFCFLQCLTQHEIEVSVMFDIRPRQTNQTTPVASSKWIFSMVLHRYASVPPEHVCVNQTH